MPEQSLQDICREAKDRQHITAQQISDASGVPVSSINNFFAASSKAPSVYTVGPICAALGVSVDRYFDIESEATAHERELEKLVQHQQEKLDLMERGLHTRHIIISVLFALMFIFLIYGITIDWLNPHMGLIQY